MGDSTSFLCYSSNKNNEDVPLEGSPVFKHSNCNDGGIFKSAKIERSMPAQVPVMPLLMNSALKNVFHLPLLQSDTPCMGASGLTRPTNTSTNTSMQQQETAQAMAGPLLQQKQQQQPLTNDSTALVRATQESVDTLFPHIALANFQIRNAICGMRNSNFEMKIMCSLRQYITGCRMEFEDSLTSTLKCRKLARSMARTMDLIQDVSVAFSDSSNYLHRMSELIAIYISCELSYAKEFKEHKSLIASRISHILHKHLEVTDEQVTTENILRAFVYMPKMFIEHEVMTEVFQDFIPTPLVIIQKELPDKLYIQYLIVFYYWQQLESDLSGQMRVIEFANNFMRPAKTLCLNSTYAYHLPKYECLRNATKYILQNLKFFQDLRNASIYDNCLKDFELIDLTENLFVQESNKGKAFADVVATTQTEAIRNPIKYEKETVVTTIDLTNDDETGDSEKAWLKKLQRNANKLAPSKEILEMLTARKNAATLEVIDLDSDTESSNDHLEDCDNNEPELFSLDFEHTELNDCERSGFYDDDDLTNNYFEEFAHNVLMMDPDPDPDDMSSDINLSLTSLRTYAAPKDRHLHSAVQLCRQQPTQSAEFSSVKTNRLCLPAEQECFFDNAVPAVGGVGSVPTRSQQYEMPRIVDSFSCRRDSIHLLSTPLASNESVEFADGTCQEGRVGATNEDDEETSLGPSTSFGYLITRNEAFSKSSYNDRLKLAGLNIDLDGFDRYNAITAEQEQSISKQQQQQQQHVKKQVKFNINPMGPSRPPDVTANKNSIIKPAISVFKHKSSTSAAAFQRYNCSSPASSSSSVCSESLKQLAKKEHIEATATVFSIYSDFKARRNSNSTTSAFGLNAGSKINTDLIRQLPHHRKAIISAQYNVANNPQFSDESNSFNVVSLTTKPTEFNFLDDPKLKQKCKVLVENIVTEMGKNDQKALQQQEPEVWRRICATTEKQPPLVEKSQCEGGLNKGQMKRPHKGKKRAKCSDFVRKGEQRQRILHEQLIKDYNAKRKEAFKQQQQQKDKQKEKEFIEKFDEIQKSCSKLKAAATSQKKRRKVRNKCRANVAVSKLMLAEQSQHVSNKAKKQMSGKLEKGAVSVTAKRENFTANAKRPRRKLEMPGVTPEDEMLHLSPIPALNTPTDPTLTILSPPSTLKPVIVRVKRSNSKRRKDSSLTSAGHVRSKQTKYATELAAEKFIRIMTGEMMRTEQRQQVLEAVSCKEKQITNAKDVDEIELPNLGTPQNTWLKEGNKSPECKRDTEAEVGENESHIKSPEGGQIEKEKQSVTMEDDPTENVTYLEAIEVTQQSEAVVSEDGKSLVECKDGLKEQLQAVMAPTVESAAKDEKVVEQVNKAETSECNQVRTKIVDMENWLTSGVEKSIHKKSKRKLERKGKKKPVEAFMKLKTFRKNMIFNADEVVLLTAGNNDEPLVLQKTDLEDEQEHMFGTEEDTQLETLTGCSSVPSPSLCLVAAVSPVVDLQSSSPQLSLQQDDDDACMEKQLTAPQNGIPIELSTAMNLTAGSLTLLANTAATTSAMLSKHNLVERKSSPVSTDTDVIGTEEVNHPSPPLSDLKQSCDYLSATQQLLTFGHSVDLVDTVKVVDMKGTPLSLLNVEATPTVPAYLFNGESRDVPTPTLVAGTEHAIDAAYTDQISVDISLMSVESTQLNPVLSSTSDHEVSSTQETIPEIPKRNQAVPVSKQADAALDATALMVQNNQVDTTHHLPESCHGLRRRTSRSFTHDELLASKDVLHHRPQNKWYKVESTLRDKDNADTESTDASLNQSQTRTGTPTKLRKRARATKETVAMQQIPPVLISEAKRPNCKVPPMNNVRIKRTYSKNNVTQKVFVPPEVEKCLDTVADAIDFEAALKPLPLVVKPKPVEKGKKRPASASTFASVKDTKIKLLFNNVNLAAVEASRKTVVKFTGRKRK